MDTEQLMFDAIVIEVEDRHRAAQDELRSDVQHWFDRLTPAQKDTLGAWVDSAMQYDCFVALSAAAGDWHRQRSGELVRYLARAQHEGATA